MRRRGRHRPSQAPPHSPKKIKMEEEDEDRVREGGEAAAVGEARSSCKPAPPSTRALAQPEKEEEEEEEEGRALVAAGGAAATSSTEAHTQTHTGTHACAQREGIYVNMCAVYIQYSTHRRRSGSNHMHAKHMHGTACCSCARVACMRAVYTVQHAPPQRRQATTCMQNACTTQPVAAVRVELQRYKRVCVSERCVLYADATSVALTTHSALCRRVSADDTQRSVSSS